MNKQWHTKDYELSDDELLYYSQSAIAIRDQFMKRAICFAKADSNEAALEKLIEK